jgi:DNA-binding NarL/FixJ family response regulator
MTTGPIRVLLVEDSDVYRESLELVLGLVADVEVVGGVATGGAAAAACEELSADVVVIDYRLPDVSGTEAASEVRVRCPQAGVVFLSASAGEDERVAARSTGAALVRKDEGVDALVEAVRSASQAAA